MNRLLGIAMALAISIGTRASGDAITTHSLAEIKDGVYADQPPGDLRGGFPLGEVTVTPNRRFFDARTVAFASLPSDPSHAPGDGGGFGVYSNGSIEGPPPVLNFNRPVAAFGVDFYHVAPGFRPELDPFSMPALIIAYSGPDATGDLLGIAQSSGYDSTVDPVGHDDFVAVWSRNVDIRSAIVWGTGRNQGYAIDGLSYSMTTAPVPEPAGLAAWLIVASGLALGRRAIRDRAEGAPGLHRGRKGNREGVPVPFPPERITS